MNETVKILRAFRPGDVVFIEVPGSLSCEAHARYSEHLSAGLEGTGVKVVILTEGSRVAAAEEHVVATEESADTK
jgi:hypothetical protein